MADLVSQMEIEDNSGRSQAFNGTASTTVANVPAVAGEAISQLLLYVDGKNVEVSFDSGTSFFLMPDNGVLSWDVKGGITQVQIRTSSGTTDYSMLINFEEY